METSAPVIRLAETTSTNDHLAALWRSRSAAALPSFTLVLADFQTAGRGRLGRSWLAPAGTAMLASALVRVDETTQSWLSLAAGVAVAEYVRQLPGANGGPSAVLKWPNDVLIGDAKVAGILTERLGDRDGGIWAAVGVGLNLSQIPDQLPDVPATSLALAGVQVPTALDAALALREPLPAASVQGMRAALITSLGFGHVSSLIALAHPGAFEAALTTQLGAQEAAAWRLLAERRLEEGAHHLEAGMLGRRPLFEPAADRRLPTSGPAGKEAEAAMLLDPKARLGASGKYAAAR